MLTQTRIKELLYYNPETGEMHWKKPLVGRMRSRAGWSRGNGHRHIFIEGNRMLEHIAIWLYMTGELPDFEIDHNDLDKTNNRWKNLRGATHAQNNANKRVQKNNSLGIKGVAFHRQHGITYARAKVTALGKTREKCFSVAKMGVMEATAAAAVWARATRSLVHGEFANH